MQEENLVRGRAFDFDGGIGDLVWVRLFFSPNLCGYNFFPDINNLTMSDYFPNITSHEKYFSSVRKLFPPGISLQELFFPRNQSAGYFFLKSPIPPKKSQTFGPLRRNVHPPVHPIHFQVRHFLILIQQQEVLVFV